MSDYSDNLSSSFSFYLCFISCHQSNLPPRLCSLKAFFRGHFISCLTSQIKLIEILCFNLIFFSPSHLFTHLQKYHSTLPTADGPPTSPFSLSHAYTHSRTHVRAHTLSSSSFFGQYINPYLTFSACVLPWWGVGENWGSDELVKPFLKRKTSHFKIASHRFFLSSWTFC